MFFVLGQGPHKFLYKNTHFSDFSLKRMPNFQKSDEKGPKNVFFSYVLPQKKRYKISACILGVFIDKKLQNADFRRKKVIFILFLASFWPVFKFESMKSLELNIWDLFLTIFLE